MRSTWNCAGRLERKHPHRGRLALRRAEEQTRPRGVSRGNSVYLADRVIPMLPEALSNGLCSLRPNVDRLTFSVFARINRKGKATPCALRKP